MSRTLNVVRMQFVNRQTYIWVPLLVLGGSFVLSLLIYAMIPYDGPKYGGGSQAPLWYFFAVGVQSLTLTFPFSQAMSVTRREFYLGTLLTAGVTSFLLSAIFVVGGLVEKATNGWGMNGYFFYLDWMWAAGPAGAFVVYFVIAMLFFVTGFWCATIYKRFGPLWLTTVLVVLGLGFVGLLWLVGRLNAWEEVFVWFGETGALGLALWGILAGAVLAAVSFLTLRRAVP
ncbi:hypothetical protein [Microbacterium terricola]|uniref:ABC transporter permease n=1 Tax=Microbacterium terricola TaxID=344163 RepID=A0ABM8DUS3_9MICO|nr:hypothetical protein [Microbacterium terricola]UYK39834.1 hypothetical protein OAU46_14225 [Microbacterium terricola]BDV29414.1 hypothetical protein Microterr_00740 [Microbacterium terricola]